MVTVITLNCFKWFWILKHYQVTYLRSTLVQNHKASGRQSISKRYNPGHIQCTVPSQFNLCPIISIRNDFQRKIMSANVLTELNYIL